MALDSVKEYQSLDIDPSKENFPVFTGDGCDRYQLVFPHSGIQFEVDRLRRQRNELIGELTVRCDLPGARAVNGCLTVGDFNFSSVRARSDRAKLADRSGEHDGSGLVRAPRRILPARTRVRASRPATD